VGTSSMGADDVPRVAFTLLKDARVNLMLLLEAGAARLKQAVGQATPEAAG